jgi:hypothetical protein
VYSWYFLDLNSFVEQLCENKDKPELQCNGTCYLSKMSADTTTDDGTPLPALEWEQLVYCQTAISEEQTKVIAINSTTYFWRGPQYKQKLFTSIFHPPRYS